MSSGISRWSASGRSPAISGSRLRSHAGQCAFPGGGVEPQDASSEAAAFREAAEEVGLRAETVELLGVLPAAHVAVTGYDVVPVVGWWRAPHPLRIVDAIERRASDVSIGLAERFYSQLNAALPRMIDRGLSGQVAKARAIFTL